LTEINAKIDARGNGAESWRRADDLRPARSAPFFARFCRGQVTSSIVIWNKTKHTKLADQLLNETVVVKEKIHIFWREKK
jgi:hypothetical protein